MKLVRIIWLDAVLQPCEMPRDKAIEVEPVRRENVGYRLLEDENKLIVSFGLIYHETMMHDQVFVIPKCMILEIQEMK